MPDKKPAYRADRPHDKFLTQLRPFFDPMPSKPVDLTEDYVIEESHYLGGCKYTDEYTKAWLQLRSLEEQQDAYRATHGVNSPDILRAIEQITFPNLTEYLSECQSKLMVYSSLVGHNTELLNDGLLTACNQLFNPQELTLDDVKPILDQYHRHGTYLL